MSPQKIIIDCDPGVDDALAIALARGSQELELVALTTVSGNVSLERTTLNARKLREYLGVPHVPVHAGCSGPFLRRRVDAAHVHGESGLGSVRIPSPKYPVNPGHAVEAIISTLRDKPGEITLVALGPLTNLALAVRTEPRIVDWAADLVILGGSYTRGNLTPAAEFNIGVDPEAAAIVLEAGWTPTMIGLDTAGQAVATASVVARMAAMGRLGAELLVPCATCYGVVTPESGPALYDVCAIAYLIDPTLFRLEPAVVHVETQGRWTSGMTVIDFVLRGRTPNARVATALDVPRFWDLTLGVYDDLAAAMAG